MALCNCIHILCYVHIQARICIAIHLLLNPCCLSATIEQHTMDAINRVVVPPVCLITSEDNRQCQDTTHERKIKCQFSESRDMWYAF